VIAFSVVIAAMSMRHDAAAAERLWPAGSSQTQGAALDYGYSG
jgi:hypothetical protein